jgi:hypothetical protein
MLDSLNIKDCFIICPLGDEHSETRKKSNTFLKFVFNPVLETYGYKAIRADQIPKVGLITTQIINLIIESPLIIADLTDLNPNVFYELAIRHTTRKPYIQVITKGQKIPFDVSGIRTIEIDIKDLESVESAKKEIGNQIIAFNDGHIADSPISVASSVRLLQSDSDLAEEIAEKLSYLTNYQDSGYCRDESGHDVSDKIEEIQRKLWGFREFSSIGMEDLSSKMDFILNKLNEIERG